jgi:beta-glucosidase
MPFIGTARQCSRVASVLGLHLSVCACSSDAAKTPVASPEGGTDAGIDAGSGEDGGAALASRAAALVGQMTLDEKLSLMAGTGVVRGLWQTPGVARLGFPGYLMTDGARGLGAPNSVDDPHKGTAFPVGMARGATFDVALEERVGTAIGKEVRAWGGNVILAPVVNVLRHPAWGRAQETYGEDPVHLGAMGSAFVRGAQHHAIANPKHFAANDIEDTRFTVSVNLDERTLREVFLAPFKATIDAGALSVMAAYNRVNGTYSCENVHLLRDILKGEWGFTGFVESDWIAAVRSTAPSVVAGLDIEMPSASWFTPPKLQAAIDSGDIPMPAIDEAAGRIVRAELDLESRRDATAPDIDVVGGQEHADLALEVARKSIVLLQNRNGALPLDRASVKKLAVVGTFAGIARLGDDGSSKVVPGHAVTPLDGIRARAPSVSVEHVDADVVASADEPRVSSADAAVVVVGLGPNDERENVDLKGGDRKSLGLSAAHVALIEQVAALNPRTIVVMEAGSALLTKPWRASVGAVVMAWYPGQEGGSAIADVLFGDANPSGRLPLTFPEDESQLPPFDHTSADVTYGYLHGYRYVDDQGSVPAFPFGFGLSYTTFALSNLVLSKSTIPVDGATTATVDVENTGAEAGDEVVQLYVAYPGSSVQHGPNELRAFARVHLAAGAKQTVSLDLPATDLAYYDVGAKAWKVEPLAYTVSAGTSSRDLPLHAELRVK